MNIAPLFTALIFYVTARYLVELIGSFGEEGEGAADGGTCPQTHTFWIRTGMLDDIGVYSWTASEIPE